MSELVNEFIQINLEKNFNEFPDPFEELIKMDKENIISFLVSVNKLYLIYIKEEKNMKLKTPVFDHIIERIKGFNKTGDIAQFGSYGGFGGIADALLSHARYLVNIRNADNSIYESSQNNVSAMMMSKYIHTLYLGLIVEKFYKKWGVEKYERWSAKNWRAKEWGTKDWGSNGTESISGMVRSKEWLDQIKEK